MYRMSFLFRSGTEVNTPRAITSRSILANQSSTWFSHNTVHLMTLIAFLMLTDGSGLAFRGRSGKLLILRFTPRGLRRARLDTTRSCRISLITRSCSALLSSGGNSVEGKQFAPHHPHRMQVPEAVGIRVA